MHHKDVQFILKGLCHQIRKFQFEVQNKCKAICIIADEWSDDASQEYCSVSARYVMDNLDEGIIFLGFFRLENIRAETIANVIMKAFSVIKGIDITKKIIAQTYDGASNM